MGKGALKNLEIPEQRGAYFAPKITFNVDTGKCEISGESYIEDTLAFYRPILEWLKRYAEEVQEHLELSIRLKYYNTSSSKYLLQILKLLKNYQEVGGAVEVYWYYPEVDTSIMEEAEDYRDFLELDITIMPY